MSPPCEHDVLFEVDVHWARHHQRDVVARNESVGMKPKSQIRSDRFSLNVHRRSGAAQDEVSVHIQRGLQVGLNPDATRHIDQHVAGNLDRAGCSQKDRIGVGRLPDAVPRDPHGRLSLVRRDGPSYPFEPAPMNFHVDTVVAQDASVEVQEVARGNADVTLACHRNGLIRHVSKRRVSDANTRASLGLNAIDGRVRNLTAFDDQLTRVHERESAQIGAAAFMNGRTRPVDVDSGNNLRIGADRNPAKLNLTLLFDEDRRQGRGTADQFWPGPWLTDDRQPFSGDAYRAAIRSFAQRDRIAVARSGA